VHPGLQAIPFVVTQLDQRCYSHAGSLSLNGVY
jgi:hypothetical protein